MSSLHVLILIALIAWFWYSNLQAREHASLLAKRVCQQNGLQFLDGTAALIKMGICRDRSSRIAIQRVYQFEFTTTGDTRMHGEIHLQGRQLEQIKFPENDPLDSP